MKPSETSYESCDDLVRQLNRSRTIHNWLLVISCILFAIIFGYFGYLFYCLDRQINPWPFG